MDGFDERGDVKVIMATNRIESLDPALLRPGRIDRKIEFPLPDIKTKRHIFQIHTGRMTLADDVNLEEFVMAKDKLSGELFWGLLLLLLLTLCCVCLQVLTSKQYAPKLVFWHCGRDVCV